MPQIYLFSTIAFLFGLVFGSFNNVLIHRLPKDQNIGGRSRCLHCQREIPLKDLIPLLSYIVLRGKCRRCGKDISIYYPIVELLTGLAFSFVTFWVLNYYLSLSIFYYLPLLFFWLFFVDILIITFFSDLIYGIIPDQVTFSSMVVAVVYQIFTPAFNVVATYLSLKFSSSPLAPYFLPPYSNHIYTVAWRGFSPLLATLIAAFIIGLVFYLIIVFSKGRAMGGGDLKLGFLMSLILGWPLVLVAIFIGLLTGALLSVLLILIHRKRFGQTVPFGPFLTVGTFVTIFWGQRLLDWYINLLNGR